MKQFTYTRRKPKLSPEMTKASYCIDHVPTGKRLLGYSSNVDKEVDRQLRLLSTGKHPSRKMQKLFDAEDEMVVYLYPAKTNSIAKKESLEQRKAIPDYNSHLLLN